MFCVDRKMSNFSAIKREHFMSNLGNTSVFLNYSRMEDTIRLDTDGNINKLRFRPVMFLVRKLTLNIVAMS